MRNGKKRQIKLQNKNRTSALSPQPNKTNFNKNIFINCPFDEEYKPMLRALLFTVVECGFVPRIASESSDSGEIRVEKIKNFIKKSRYSIHDISRMEASRKGEIPRFNMPFELGLDLGCRDFGPGRLSKKKCLILEKEQYRYRKSLSDISGNDIKAHNSDPETLIRRVRDWIVETARSNASSGTHIWHRFNVFYKDFVAALKKSDYAEKDIEEMPVVEFIDFIKEWKKSSKA
ncbi:MAG TPA: hypothetical protein VNN20_05760 [Thermodesulfobacteriota bacterium]|nr:hypothetical protein [Thermodesulfobacteriota bacterium]